MDNVLVSAPGKLILHGEHAVVYGKKALATCLDLRTYLSLQKTELSHDSVSVNLPDINRSLSWACGDLNRCFSLPLCDAHNPEPASDDTITALSRFADISLTVADTKDLAVLAFLYLYCSISAEKGYVPSAHVDVASHLPPGAGLGSSAAYSTCLSAALLLWKGHISPPPEDNSWAGPELKLINSWAFQAEKIIHGRPSGIDNSVSTYGGALTFHNGEISLLEGFPEVSVLVMNTHIPRSTKQLVAGVRKRYNKYPSIIAPVLESIEAITAKCIEVLTMVKGPPSQEQLAELEDLIQMNQHQLGVLGVGHPSLDTVCHLCARHGLSAKLTGAGGGGCAFALLTEDKEAAVGKITKEAEQHGYSCWKTTVGGPGVQYHPSTQAGLSMQLPSVLHDLLKDRIS